MKSFLSTPATVTADQKGVWGNVASTYSKTITVNGHIMKDALAPFVTLAVTLLTDRRSGKVLDVACGPGEPALTIASALPSVEVIATDFSEGMVAATEKRIEEIGLKNVRCEQADAMDLRAFEDGSIDLVTMSFGLMFVPEPVKALQEFYRVLKPGGSLALGVWAAEKESMQFASFSGQISTKLELGRIVTGNTLAGEGCKALEDELEKTGFQVEDVRDINNRLHLSEEQTFDLVCGMVSIKPFLDEKLAAGETGVLERARQAVQEVGVEGGYLKDGYFTLDPNVSHFLVAKKPE